MPTKLGDLVGTIIIPNLPPWVMQQQANFERVKATAFAAFGEFGDDVWEFIEREAKAESQTGLSTMQDRLDYWMDWALTGRYEIPISMTGWQKRRKNVQDLITRLEDHQKYFR